MLITDISLPEAVLLPASLGDLPQAFFATLPAVIAIWLIVSVCTSAVAVAIVGPRSLSAVTRATVVTFLGSPIVVVSIQSFLSWHMPDAASGVLALLVVPFGVALVQRSILDRGAAGHVHRWWWVLAGLVVGSGLGVVVGFLAALVFGEMLTVPLFVAIGAVCGAAVGRTEGTKVPVDAMTFGRHADIPK